MLSKLLTIFLTSFFTITSPFDLSRDTFPEKREEPNAYLTETYYKSDFGGEVKYYVLREGVDFAGHAIYLSRGSGKVKSKYFAYGAQGEVFQKFTSSKTYQKPIMAFSGAYAYKAKSNISSGHTEYFPVALTIDSGKPVNRHLKPDMDGLVIVYATGGIVVSNIEDGDLFLKSLGRKVDIRKDVDRFQFIKWAGTDIATVFQTHLLVYKNKKKYSLNYRGGSAAERRMLALAYDADDNLFHIVFNIKKAYQLTEISDKIHSLLQRKNFNTIALVNLDTGMFDFMKAYDSYGNEISNIDGKKNNEFEKATNLVYYHYVK